MKNNLNKFARANGTTSTGRTMRRYEVLIFLTGAATLSLEVLSSRIMTPYFGVSLYIWSGILSITLTFLALGYSWGGWLSKRAKEETTEYWFLILPILSALSIAISAATYPILFPELAKFDLVAGSFIGAAVLLGFPLITLSAMNPLLITIQRKVAEKGDGGAGRIFFISTIGSVAGVLITAFLFIPNITNFRSILAIGIVLCVINLTFVFLARDLSRRQKRFIASGLVWIAAASSLLFAGKKTYLEFITDLSPDELVFEVQAEFSSVFGNIKVADVKFRGEAKTAERYFIQDGLIQNRTDLNFKSISAFSYVLESLSHAFAPAARDVLVLGLGAGVVPRHFKSDGLNVSVVEINRSALDAAINYFGFDQTGISVFLEDARTYVRTCKQQFDVVAMDLFQGDNIPDYLLTTEFFSDLKNCLRPGGSVVINGILDEFEAQPNRRLFATIAEAFPRIYLSGIAGGNIYIVGTAGRAPDVISIENSNIPDEIFRLVAISVTGSTEVDRRFYQFSKPISDDHNIFSVLFSKTNMRERQFMAENLPPHILVN